MKSYSLSHQVKGLGKKYDAELYTGKTYDSYVWELEQFTLDRIIKEINLRKKIKTLIDFACGTGRILHYLSHNPELKGSKLIGVDISNNMLVVAREKLDTKIIELIRGDIITDQKLRDEISKYSPHMITSFRFFLNAEETLRKDVLESFKGITRSDYTLIGNVHGGKPSLRSFDMLSCQILQLIKKLLKKQDKNNCNFNFLSQSHMKKLLIESDYTNVRIYPIAFLPRLTVRRLKLPRKLYIIIEKTLQKIPFIKGFATDYIFTAEYKNASQI